MNAPRISDAAAETALMRTWIRHDACRLAASYWWGRHSLDDARVELRGIAQMKDGAARGMNCRAFDVADQELEDAIHAQEMAHTASLEAMTEAALVSVRQGANYERAYAAALSVARSRELLPPPQVVQQAVENAAAEYRRSLFFWRQRERAA